MKLIHGIAERSQAYGIISGTFLLKHHVVRCIETGSAIIVRQIPYIPVIRHGDENGNGRCTLIDRAQLDNRVVFTIVDVNDFF